jgi:hypothetical protein
VLGCTAGTAGTANAQAICAMIAMYFVTPPSVFIDEHGERIRDAAAADDDDDDRRWKSRQKWPNADCEVSRSSTDVHAMTCKYNTGSNQETVNAFGKQAERDVDLCLQQIPNGQGYEKDTQNRTFRGRATTTISWTKKTSDAVYAIQVRVDQDAKGVFSNSVSVVWGELSP